MANPFQIFRKRQKLFLAVAGVGAMAAFIFLPILGRILEGRGKNSTSVVVTKYGKIGEQDMDSLIRQRQISNTFFDRLLKLTLNSLLQGGQINGQNFSRFAQFKQNELLREGLLLPPNETSVVRGMMAAKRAEELGLRVSDDRINQLILRVSQDVVTADEIAGILRSMNVRISLQQLFDFIRPELLANDLLYLVGSGTQTNTTPAERWNYFLRSRRQTTAELVEVAVDDFLDQVPDPSKEDLLAYFNAHKEEYPQPDSPEPGFRLPERRAFEYFKADFEHFYDAGGITDEEVAEYYEANKKNFPYRGLPPDTSTTETTDSGETEADEPGSEEPVNEEPPTENNPAETKKMPADEPEESADKPESSEPDDKTKPDAEKPSETPSTEEEPPAEEPSGSGDAPPSGDTPGSSESSANEDRSRASRGGRSLQRLLKTAVIGALFLEDEEAESGSETESDPDETETTANPVSEGSETPASDSPAEESNEEVSEAAAASQDKPRASMLSLRDLSVDYLLPRIISQGHDPQYDPLWRVEESIRKTLAREKASEKMKAVLTPLRQEMQAYSTRRLDWEMAQEEKRDVAEPQRFDFKSLAADLDGVTAESTGIVSAQQLIDNWDLGKTSVFNTTGQVTGSTIKQSYGTMPDYSAVKARDSDGNEYLYWIVNKREAKIPTLDEVRDAVLLSWKRKEARQLAQEHAEALADIAGDPKFDSLAQAFADKPEIKVVDTGSFSWLTAGEIPQTFGGGQLRLSEIPGVRGMSNDFMRAVFSLAPQSVGVIFNAPRTDVHVVRVGKFTPDEFILRQQFLAAPYSLYQNAGQIDRQETQRRWFDELLADAKIKWLREPRDRR